MNNNDVVHCPFCGKNYSFNIDYKFSQAGYDENIGNANKYLFNANEIYLPKRLAASKSDIFELNISKCPYCNEEFIDIKRCFFKDGSLNYKEDQQLNVQIRPKSIHKAIPEYVPQAIRNDYIEACAILNLSPKAAATLARRALEGMILDFWSIPAKAKGSLKAEIAELQGKIPPNQWKAIDALRNLGNIGAHMENNVNIIVDIDPGEAEKLIRLIELLIQQWYIADHEQEQLYNDIVDIDNDKQKERKNAGNIPAQK